MKIRLSLIIKSIFSGDGSAPEFFLEHGSETYFPFTTEKKVPNSFLYLTFLFHVQKVLGSILVSQHAYGLFCEELCERQIFIQLIEVIMKLLKPLLFIF